MHVDKTVGDLARLKSPARQRLAVFDAQCAMEMVLEYKLQFTLVVSWTHGVTIDFDKTPVYDLQYYVDADPNCVLWAQLGFLAAEMTLDSSSDIRGHLSVTHDQKSDKWDRSLTLNAVVAGQSELGFAGKWKKDLSAAQNTLQALPHFEAHLLMQWSWDASDPSSSPHQFKVSDGAVCIGSMLQRVLRSVVGIAGGKVYGPLDKILGRDGLLNKRLHPTEFLFGREMTVAEFALFLSKYYCSGCDVRNVREILATFQQVGELVSFCSSLAQTGCTSKKKFQDFLVDFRNPKPVVIPDGAAPPDVITFEPGFDPKVQGEIIVRYRSVTTTPFGVKWLITTDKAAADILALILEQNIEIVQVTLPSASFLRLHSLGRVCGTHPR